MMKLVTPAYIASLVNFHSNVLHPEWTYEPGKKDMRSLQVLGAAHICNILATGEVALLADEVGMGKTIQALTVCAALWNMNPKARILVIAPRGEVAHNWEKEYLTFIHHHYRRRDNVVKTISGEQPVKEMQYCENLYQLVQKLNEGWGQLFVGKISSFSSLLSQKNVDDRLESVGIEVPRKFRNLVQRAAGNEGTNSLNAETALLLKQHIDGKAESQSKPYFDLLIIDEAHYLRHKDGGSLRAEAAKIIFGDRASAIGKPLAKKALLLTATPNHSAEQDIYQVVSYFTNKYENGKGDYASILKDICVRRLRRLSSKALNKYEYRHEIPSEADFKENPLGEIFFGLYQHELARKIIQEDNNATGGGSVSRMMKYLEGVEFVSRSREKVTEGPEEEDEGKKNAAATDYARGEDAEILYDLSSRFFDLFKSDPAHPKYEKLIEDIGNQSNNAKSVVFVRRIPSVREISARVRDLYDKRLWHLLQVGPWQSLSLDTLNRKTFQERHLQFAGGREMLDSDEDLEGISDDESRDAEDIPTSRVLDLFKILKGKALPATAATNFRIRFNRSKPGPFTIFFAPGEDYYAKPYTGLQVYHYEEKNQTKDSYFYAALEHRLNCIDESTRHEIAGRLILKRKVLDREPQCIEGSLPTLFTVFWATVSEDISLTNEQKEELKSTYAAFTPYEKEAFSLFVEKGALLASEFVVWLFARFYALVMQTEFQNQPVKIYSALLDQLKLELKDLRLYEQMQEALLQFRNIYTKQFSINHELNLLLENWDSFEKSQPIYPYSAKIKNQKVLKCFNTPFYPDVLVATSVLQEGVNLQFFCDTVHHYGMAWTPGDNEQRNGRIDRMFGKIERNLDRKEGSTLNIYYPYLKDTVDEEQLARFVRRKHKSEQLIDQGKAYQDEPVDILESEDMQSWTQFLRKPGVSALLDPFPVSDDCFQRVQAPPQFVQPKVSSLQVFFDYVANCILGCVHLNTEIFKIHHDEGDRLLADVKLPLGRTQPTQVELLHDPVGSGSSPAGRAVYCLTMRTPLAGIREWKNMEQKISSIEFSNHYPMGVKLCYDEKQQPSSPWGIYLSYELPLFITSIDGHHLHPESEIQSCFERLVNFADWLEQYCFRERDLTRIELWPNSESIPAKKKFHLSGSRRRTEEDWQSEGNYLYMRREIDQQRKSIDQRQALRLNHQMRYVRLLRQHQHWLAEVSYPKADAQKEELSLLKKHLEVAQNRIVESKSTMGKREDVGEDEKSS